jgi:outer membrane protein assembly factor BamB
MRRLATTLLMTATLVAGAVTPLGAAGHTYPDVIPLPNGFFPEGIAVGHGHTFYAGSLVDGAIAVGDLRNGEVSILVEGTPGTVAVGMDFDESSGHLFVAGGPGGTLTVYDTADGSTVDQLALPGAFLNDVIVAGNTVYVTDSFVSQFFAVSLDRKGVPTGDVAVVPLTGEWVEAPGFNANGIEATAKGDTLIIVNASTGTLYAVDPASGVATEIDLGGTMVNGDGLVLTGRTLYAVENSKNQITEIRLSPDLASGEITDTITSPAFDVPTTAAKFGSSLYAVNARFSTPPLPTTTYDVVRVDR